MAAVGTERVSKIVGYLLTKGDYSESSPNLPQRIAILGEANTANQGSLDTDGKVITSAQQAGEEYGYGSPIYHMMRIIRSTSGDTTGGIPTIVYPQAESGATAKVLTVTPTGTATGNATHTLVIAGRKGMEGVFYSFTVATGDNVAAITAKITDAINNVLGSPVIAVDDTTEATCTSKWAGLTADDITITVDTGGKDVGMSYAVVSTQSGAGTPSVQAALDQFGSDWVTVVLNGYGLESTTTALLEAFNGIPDPETPTGRYLGTIMKPFIALTGSTSDDPSTTTDAKKSEVTIAMCPAPGSDGLQFEAAANMAALFSRITQDNPHLDVSGKSYPDMPTPTSIGSMASEVNRDVIVKKGCSTVDLVAGSYQVVDFVSTYHPDGENPPQYRWCRNQMIDFNVRFGYYLLEQINVVDHAIAEDNDIVTASKVIKPKQWLQIISAYAEDMAKRALIVEPSFMQDSATVAISTTNPDRLEVFFRYKRSGFTRIVSTTAEAGFNFGTLN